MSRLLELLRASVRRERAWADTRIDEAEWAPAGRHGDPQSPGRDFLATVPLPLGKLIRPERPR